jgi:hypothetical protein
VTDSFIPGWETGLTINLIDVGVIGNVLSLDQTRAGLSKPVFGTPHRRELPGQRSGTLTASGHVSKEKLPDLQALIESDVAVAYVIEVGLDAGALDAGEYAGQLVITQLTLDSDAEDQWSWSLAGNLDGAPTYTPPA